MIKVKDLEEEFAEEFVDAGLLVLPKRKKMKAVTTEATCCHSHLASCAVVTLVLGGGPACLVVRWKVMCLRRWSPSGRS